MATTINRVLYSAQTAQIAVGGHLDKVGGAYQFVAYAPVGAAAQTITNYLLPVQTASADETIPQEDVLVLGNLGGVGRVQKDAASSKASIKAYLGSDMTIKDTGAPNPAEGTTAKAAPGGLAGKSFDDGGVGLLETLRAEAIGGREGRVQLSRPGGGNDGFLFHGICSNISIDVSKGAFPTIDLAFEGTGLVEEMFLKAKDSAGGELNQDNAGEDYIETCTPHTHDDVEIWGYERDYDADGKIDNEASILIAAGDDHAIAGTDPTHAAPGAKEGTDTMASCKLSYDMPTETLTALGEEIEGTSIEVRDGNRTFSKPPFKATMTVDGQGLMLAGWGKDAAGGLPDERIIATAIVIGDLTAQIDKDGAATSARSFSQNVGDVGATYSVTVEGTDADFESN
jgi:hypothetical protein